MATDEAFAQAIKEPTISTPHRKPQAVQAGERHDKTGDQAKRKEIAIDTAKDVTRLDLSSLDDEDASEQSSPTGDGQSRSLRGKQQVPTTGEAESAAFLTDSALRELVQLWFTLDQIVQQAILSIVRSSAR